jgi:hypothetical protein
LKLLGFSQAAKLVHPRQKQPFFRRRPITSFGRRPARRFAGLFTTNATGNGERVDRAVGRSIVATGTSVQSANQFARKSSSLAWIMR